MNPSSIYNSTRNVANCQASNSDFEFIKHSQRRVRELLKQGKYDDVALTEYGKLDQFVDFLNQIGYLNILKDKSPAKGQNGVPNFLSDDRVFVEGRRQKCISKTKLKNWLELDATDICETDEQLRNYNRNKMMVDLSMVPQTIQNRIMNEYDNEDNPKVKDKSKILNYLISKRMKLLIGCVQDF